jgi:hypothetical protein
MAKGQSYYGSIDVTTLLKQANLPHSAFVRAGKEKKAFAQITVWVNDEPDQYGNSLSIKLQSKDAAAQAVEGNIYLGNLKKSEPKAPEPLEADAGLGDGSDFPF